MSNTRKQLSRILNLQISKPGFQKSCVHGVDYVKFSATTPRRRTYWQASFVIILQGHKDITLEEFAYKYKEAHTILTPVGLPVLSRVVVEDASKPFLAIRIAFDPLEMQNVARLMLSPEESPILLKAHGIFKGPADEKLLSVLLRLVELSEDDALVLGPMVIREIYFHLLKSPNGPVLRQFVLGGSKFQAIAEAARRIREDISAKINVEKLAKEARMSRTGFFDAFKQVTAMSPIQFQKKLRLLQARHLLSSDNETAENVAFAVGYKSPSQFSREYSRMFGHPPGGSSRS